MEMSSRYDQIMVQIFKDHYRADRREIVFGREDLTKASKKLGIAAPKNLGDIVYSYRYRKDLPEEIRAVSKGEEGWILVPRGTARYALVMHPKGGLIEAPECMYAIKIPDATPEIIEENRLSDEQAILARVRYNRLVDLFTGMTAYPLQSHYRTSLQSIGQIEVDEIYIGVDKQGRQYYIPVEAKAGKDRLSVVQIGQDILCGQERFPSLICKPLAAFEMEDASLMLFEFVAEDRWEKIEYLEARRYELVPAEEVPENQKKGISGKA
jgi:hypothetical protein